MKVMPKEWNIAHEGREGYLRMDYGKMTTVLFGAMQDILQSHENLLEKVKKLKEEVKELKGKGKGEPKAKPKTKSKD